MATLSLKNTEVSSSGSTLTVGCKLPHGMHLDFLEPGRPLRRVTIKGTNSARVIGGYGITEDVPEAYFNEWMAKHQELPAVRNGLIFAMAKYESTVAKAKEMAKEKNGLEPLSPVAQGIETLGS